MSKLRVFSCPPVLLSSCLPVIYKKNKMKKNYNKHDRKRDPKHVPIMTKLIVKFTINRIKIIFTSQIGHTINLTYIYNCRAIQAAINSALAA